MHLEEERYVKNEGLESKGTNYFVTGGIVLKLVGYMLHRQVMTI